MFRNRHPGARRGALIVVLALAGCVTREGGLDSAQGSASDSAPVLALGTPTNAAAGLPFGPFHLPDSMLGRPFTSTIRGARNTAEAIATLDAARKAKASVILRLARGSSRFSNPDSSFSLDRWKAEIDRYQGAEFGEYVADGTLLGHMLFDEPHDPTNWNGKPVPYSEVVAAAAYSRMLWPTVPTGIGAPPSELKKLRAGASRGALDFALAQHRPKKGEIRAWRDQEVAAAKEQGYGVILSLQALEGNSGQPLTAEQVRIFGSVLAADPYACMLSMWKWDEDDPRYFQRADIREAIAAVAAVAGRNRARPCDPRAAVSQRVPAALASEPALALATPFD